MTFQMVLNEGQSAQASGVTFQMVLNEGQSGWMIDTASRLLPGRFCLSGQPGDGLDPAHSNRPVHPLRRVDLGDHGALTLASGHGFRVPIHPEFALVLTALMPAWQAGSSLQVNFSEYWTPNRHQSFYSHNLPETVHGQSVTFSGQPARHEMDIATVQNSVVPDPNGGSGLSPLRRMRLDLHDQPLTGQLIRALHRCAQVHLTERLPNLPGSGRPEDRRDRRLPLLTPPVRGQVCAMHFPTPVSEGPQIRDFTGLLSDLTRRSLPEDEPIVRWSSGAWQTLHADGQTEHFPHRNDPATALVPERCGNVTAISGIRVTLSNGLCTAALHLSGPGQTSVTLPPDLSLLVAHVMALWDTGTDGELRFSLFRPAAPTEPAFTRNLYPEASQGECGQLDWTLRRAGALTQDTYRISVTLSRSGDAGLNSESLTLQVPTALQDRFRRMLYRVNQRYLVDLAS